MDEQKLSVSKIECDELVIKSKNGSSIVLKSWADGVGAWFSQKGSGPYLALVVDETGCPYIAISRNQNGVPQLAISVNDDGKMRLQCAPNGEVLPNLELKV